MRGTRPPVPPVAEPLQNRYAGSGAAASAPAQNRHVADILLSRRPGDVFSYVKYVKLDSFHATPIPRVVYMPTYIDINIDLL